MHVDSDRNRALFRKLRQVLGRESGHLLPETVHLLRTVSRRVESLLEIACGDEEQRPRRLARALKRLRRRAGRIRDLDVQIAALRKLRIGREPERRARLMNALSEARADREEELIAWLSGKRREKLRHRLSQVDGALNRAVTRAAISASAQAAGDTAARRNGHGPGAGAENVLRTFDPAAEALRRFAALSRRTGKLSAENLHAFRTGCKKVRYVAEMGAGERAQQIVEKLKAVQVAIGDWHDWDTLRRSAEEMFGKSVQSALVMALDNLAEAKLQAAIKAANETRREMLAEHRAAMAESAARRRPVRAFAAAAAGHHVA